MHRAGAATITSGNAALVLENHELLRPHLVAIDQRVALDSALHITFVLQNYAQHVIALDLELLFDADFCDVFEMRDGLVRQLTTYLVKI